jgi:Plasmid encoded RepA protein
MTSNDPKPQSIREYLASGGSKEFQDQIKAACAQRGISLDSPWPLPLTKSAAVAEPEQPAPAPESAPRRNERVVQPKSGDQAAAPDKRPRSKRQRRQAADAVQIYTTPPTSKDVVFLARELILCTLPHSDPGNVPTWSRTNGNLTLRIQPTYKKDPETGKDVCIGYPYGIIPRLILVWIVTEIIRTKSRRLELGNRLADFLLKLGLDPSRGGDRSDIKRFRQQMERLLSALISFEYSLKGEGRSGRAWLDMKIAPKAVLWWSDKDPDQNSLFGSWIEVGEEFFNAIMNAPHPLDIRVVRHVKDSSLGIDLYTILNREAYRAMKDDKPRFLAWEWLHEQTGNEYKRLDLFRRDALIQIEAITEVHSGLILKQQRPCKGRKSGLVISNLSTPSILPKLAKAKIEADPDRPPPALALVPPPEPPAPPPERLLKPATVAKFRALYPNLDPYACKAAFDAWAAGLAPERQPRYYNAAFMGFAQKWIVGKLVVNNP